MKHIQIFKRGFFRNRLVAQYPADTYSLVISTDGVLTVRPCNSNGCVAGYRASVSVLALSPNEWSYAFETSNADSMRFNPFNI